MWAGGQCPAGPHPFGCQRVAPNTSGIGGIGGMSHATVSDCVIADLNASAGSRPRQERRMTRHSSQTPAGSEYAPPREHPSTAPKTQGTHYRVCRWSMLAAQ